MVFKSPYQIRTKLISGSVQATIDSALIGLLLGNYTPLLQDDPSV